jgi:hypothetical protein
MRVDCVRAVLVVTSAIVAAGPPCVGPLGAQGGRSTTFVAGVADAETGQPLEGAEVVLLGAHRLARANALGDATIDGVPWGVQRVRVRQLGYAPAEVDLAMKGDTTGAVFRLQRTALRLETMKVEAEWMPPQMKDFEARRRQGVGRFLTEADLERDRDRDFQLAMTTRFPGLRTVIDSNNHRVLASTRDQLGLSGIAACYTTVYLDGMFVHSEDRDLIRTWDLAAVEYYTGNQVPARYRTKGYGCGVLLLWSKWY